MDVEYLFLFLLEQSHHLSTKLKTSKTRNRKMAAAEAYK